MVTTQAYCIVVIAVADSPCLIWTQFRQRFAHAFWGGPLGRAS